MEFHLPNLIRRDLPRKLVALFFAALIWFAIDNQLHEPAFLHGVPVTLQYDQSAMWVEDEHISADVTLQGSRRRLMRTKITDVKIVAEVPLVPAGIYFYDLRILPESIVTPPGTKAVEVALAPDEKQVAVDRIVSKRNVPIKVRFEGELPQGYKMTRCTVFPSAIDIRGPSRLLKDIVDLGTKPILLDETITQGFEVDTRLDIIPKVEMNPDVHVVIEITRHSSQQLFSELNVSVLGATDAPLKPGAPLPHADVTVHGPRTALDTLDELAIRPFIDITRITGPGRYKLPMQCWIDGPATVTAIRVYPAMVEIELVPRHGPAMPPGASDQPPGQ